MNQLIPARSATLPALVIAAGAHGSSLEPVSRWRP
jgi:hypothetical protein